MHVLRRFAPAVMLTAVLLGGPVAAASAQPADDDPDGGGHVVFVQGNDPAGNQVLVYQRARDGSLTPVASYATGGNGGRLNGAMADPLASQGSLQFDPSHDLLIGVNAGSNTLYAFHVDGTRLADRQDLDSGGTFPVSVAVHQDLVYVLNARGAGSVQGYRIDGAGRLHVIPGSTRSLDLVPNTTAMEFLTTPAQVGFTPDGGQLLVTTKNNASGSHIDVFQVHQDGRLSSSPVVNPSTTPVPFGFVFDAQQQLVVGEAGTSSVSTYRVHDNGTLQPIATASDSQIALCWIVRDHDVAVVANAGSGSLSTFRISPSGQPTLLGSTSVGAGPIDLARHGQFLYVELGGAGTIAELSIARDGTLTSLGTIPAHPGEEGIVAL